MDWGFWQNKWCIFKCFLMLIVILSVIIINKGNVCASICCHCLYVCVYVCVVHSICTACMCLCVLFVWIRRGTQQRAVKSALEYAWVCACVPSYRARASWNKCNHSAHTLLLNNAEPCLHAQDTRSLEFTLHEYRNTTKGRNDKVASGGEGCP